MMEQFIQSLSNGDWLAWTVVSCATLEVVLLSAILLGKEPQ